MILAQNYVYIALFAVVEKSVELGTAAVNAAVAIIAVDVINLSVTLSAIITQHGLLVLYTLAVISFHLIFILNGQTAVYSDFRH